MLPSPMITGRRRLDCTCVWLHLDLPKTYDM